MNLGDIKYDFHWRMGHNQRIQVNPVVGSVAQGERTVCELCYNPHSPEELENYEVRCLIVNGPQYVLKLTGTGHKARLELSFYRHDFGMVLVHQPGMIPARKILRMRNDDCRDISYDIRFDSTETLQVILLRKNRA